MNSGDGKYKLHRQKNMDSMTINRAPVTLLKNRDGSNNDFKP